MLVETWNVACEMAPFLLLGFVMAGLMRTFLSARTVEKHLGKPGWWQVTKASLLGVPLPLCSCGVLPVAASLRRHGASRPATLSFLVSTPQTGLDSFMVTYGLLGPVVAVFRVVAALVSGIVCGLLAECFPAERHTGSQSVEADEDLNGKRPTFWEGMQFGFVTLARDIGRAMLLGIVISGLLTALVPNDYFAAKLGAGWVTMFVMLLVGIPLYVCSSGSVPIALAFIKMGLSPGAALVFLISGPATNAAALATVWKLLSRRSMAIYLVTIAVCALASGWVLDQLIVSMNTDVLAHEHSMMPAWLKQVSAVVLLVVLLPSLRPKGRSV